MRQSLLHLTCSSSVSPKRRSFPHAALRSLPGTTCTGRDAKQNVAFTVLILRGGKSAERKVISARGKALIDTQLSIAVPPGTYGRVAPRSGLG